MDTESFNEFSPEKLYCSVAAACWKGRQNKGIYSAVPYINTALKHKTDPHLGFSTDVVAKAQG